MSGCVAFSDNPISLFFFHHVPLNPCHLFLACEPLHVSGGQARRSRSLLCAFEFSPLFFFDIHSLSPTPSVEIVSQKHPTFCHPQHMLPLRVISEVQPHVQRLPSPSEYLFKCMHHGVFSFSAGPLHRSAGSFSNELRQEICVSICFFPFGLSSSSNSVPLRPPQ